MSSFERFQLEVNRWADTIDLTSETTFSPAASDGEDIITVRRSINQPIRRWPASSLNARGRFSGSRGQKARASKAKQPQGPKHNWHKNPDHRLLLFYVSRRYCNGAADITKLFNHIFADDLRQNFSHGLSKATIGVQIWDCVRRKLPKALEFKEMSLKDLDCLYSRFQTPVNTAAAALNITLVLRIDAQEMAGTNTTTPPASEPLEEASTAHGHGGSGFNDAFVQPQTLGQLSPVLLPALPVTPPRRILTYPPTPPSSTRSRSKTNDPLQGLPSRGQCCSSRPMVFAFR